MDDDLDNAGQTVLVATTLATCLLASSAFIWRSNLRNLLGESITPLATLAHPVSDHKSMVNLDESSSIAVDKETKAARSKERRRRGKDPVKELLKSGKKAKGLEKVVREAAGTPSHSPAAEPPRMDHSRDHSLSTSSRSVSSASSSRGAAGLDQKESTPTGTSTSTSSHSSNTFTSPDSTRNTSPSPSEHAPSVVASKSLPLLDSDPWAWDGAGSSRKPPRFQRSVSPLPTSISMPAVSKPSSEQSISSSSTLESGTPKRVSTPHRSGTPPSLSTQTEMASLRGALEASKLREEKTKADMDRITKEVEALRWESSIWRRREVELQTHIHQLMHQLQGYAALYASISSPQQHLQVPSPTHGGTSSSNASPNGYQVPLSAPPSPIPMLSPTGMLSPMHPSPLSPFFAYPVHPSTPQHMQSSQYPIHYPTSTSGSSTESLSPDSTGSPLAAPVVFDRGRRRTRTRTQTANARIGGANGNGWKEDEQQDGAGDDEAGSDSEEDGGFSEVLADAILKRPESIRGTKRKKTKEREEEKTVEFTFPSLSNFGGMKKEAVIEDGWLQVEQNIPEEDKEPLILSYHRPSPSPASRETTDQDDAQQDIQSENHETQVPS